ncbi:putative neutral protease 2 like protein [Talaromyces proteolyticus]|uniref:Neutral protease 2 n=1 Tax=Talaromyces proteolyticus TaxID=1131652 RepID=A0AAD4Q615_9EURO|nr:putative neutral protease 2 like protein [Talaromyces proteolyticus]KAH8705221.1 putative neutral protease 2 like protein [Talaromyces proteolyticus]
MALRSILLVSLGAFTAATSCPLSVDISNVADHSVNVTITNHGDKTVTFFKGNTVFDKRPVKKLLVQGEDDKELDFSGAYVDYKQSNPPSSMFQTLTSGQAVSTVVNAAVSHKLGGVSKASVTALQHLKYVTGDSIPSHLKDMSLCSSVTSNKAVIIPDQKKAVLEHFSNASPVSSSHLTQKRDVGFPNCADNQVSDLQTAIADAIAMASAAQQAEGSQDDFWISWFKDAGQLSTTDSIYNQVINAQSTGFSVSCTDTYSACGENAMLVTITPDNVIIPCPNGGFWDLGEFADNCDASDYDRAGAILHEMTHLFGTSDYAYGHDDCENLSADQAAMNADTYELYAESVRLGGCQ